MREIPKEAEYGDLIAKAAISLRAVDPNFFTKSVTLRRADLVQMPFDFALISAERSPEHWEAAAFLFREVVRDSNYMFYYGDIDLRWLPDIQSAPLVISVVKAAMEDRSLRIVRFAELFAEAGLTDMMVTDDDVMVSHNFFQFVYVCRILMVVLIPRVYV
jgi:hypothetical protein